MDDVLVVGAGPVGLTMAAELARHGTRCRIIDRLAQPLPYCRAIGVTPRTLEVWEDMGIAREMIDAGLWIDGLRSIIHGHPPKDNLLELDECPMASSACRNMRPSGCWPAISANSASRSSAAHAGGIGPARAHVQVRLTAPTARRRPQRSAPWSAATARTARCAARSASRSKAKPSRSCSCSAMSTSTGTFRAAWRCGRCAWSRTPRRTCSSPFPSPSPAVTGYRCSHRRSSRLPAAPATAFNPSFRPAAPPAPIGGQRPPAAKTKTVGPALVVDLSHQHAACGCLPPRPRVYCRRCGAHSSPDRRAGHEHRNPGRV